MKLAYEAQEAGGSATCTLNAADEIAVEAFLAGSIPFPAIAATVAETLDRIPSREPQTVAEVLEIDRASREAAREVIEARWGEKVTTEAVLARVESIEYMVFLQNIWWYLVLIGVMILVHELGHYWAARFFDVKVEAFSFGFGPRLFGFKRGETDFRFCAILFGGYVKMAGEQLGDMSDPGDQNANTDPRNFLAKPRWQRMIIAFAGPAINVVLAVVLLTGLFMQHYLRIPTAAFADRGCGDAERRRRPRRGFAKATRWCRSTISRIPTGKTS